MLRHIFAFGPEGHLEQSNPVPKSADSADPQVLEQFIMDTEADVPAHNWVVAVLGHGGGLLFVSILSTLNIMAIPTLDTRHEHTK